MPPEDPVARDLNEIERQTRILRVEWEKFFSGVEKKPPMDQKTRLEQLIRKYASAEIRDNALRFRYMALSGTYSTMSELWMKKLRLREEGKAFGVHGLKAEALAMAPVAPSPERKAPPRAEAGGTYRVSDPQGDVDSVRALYESFALARQGTGEAAIRFEKFQDLIKAQAGRILNEKGASAVEFRLETKDGKVSLKAKVVR